MVKKKKDLKTSICDDEAFFDEKEVELFKNMCLLCIRFRLATDNISFNKMRMLYAKILELSR